MSRAILGGAEVDLVDEAGAIAAIAARLDDTDLPPLGVVSINLDHLHHLRADPAFAAALLPGGTVEWLSLIDGAPVAARAGALTGATWPRLAGSDLIDPILRAAAGRRRLGVLGGTAETHRLLRDRLASRLPELEIAGTWSPDRAELADPAACARIASEIAEAGVDVLLVALGKPRQERWIAEWGGATGARVLLAFGAVVDFLAGRVERAPAAVAAAGMEWAWRLAMEPRRLARRYLVQGPPALLALRRSAAIEHARPARRVAGSRGGAFHREGPVDVAVVVVSYNSGDRIDDLVAGLRGEAVAQSLRVVVVDNDSSDDSVARASAHDDVVVVESGGNLGYAGGVNAGIAAAGDADTILVLNPDLLVEPGAIAALLARRAASGAAVVVPLLLDLDGVVSPSLRREPSPTRMLGDALLGSRFGGRPGWLSETVHDPGDYRWPHPIDWATGAALLIDGGAARRMGRWDEDFFLYSEETDAMRRIREQGGEIWFEPGARMRHEQGGSGSSAALHALLTVNKARYAEKHLGRASAAAMRGALILHETLRARKPGHDLALRHLLRRGSWAQLPAATRRVPAGADLGSVIVPAHQEQAVIARTLRPLAPLVESGAIELVVSCNACTDATADLARSTVPGAVVLESDVPGKAAALVRADAAATRWPRLYLDADIEAPADAVVAALTELASGRVLAARPTAAYDTAGAGWAVRAYYRARSRMPGPRRALWGAGVYGMSEAGHVRFGGFVDATADDLAVDSAFAGDEKTVVATRPVRVRTPRTLDALLATLARAKRGDAELGVDTGRASARDLLGTVRGPASLVDAVVYGSVALAARRRASRTADVRWARDETSRT